MYYWDTIYNTLHSHFQDKCINRVIIYVKKMLSSIDSNVIFFSGMHGEQELWRRNNQQ